MKKLLILCLTFIIATELEVDGDLKVTGSVDVQNNPIKNVGPPTTLTDAVNGQALQDALRNEGPYEYISYKTYVLPETSNNTFKWILLGDGSSISWEHDFTSELNARALEGYEIHSMMNLPHFTSNNGGNGYTTSITNNTAFTLFILKRKIEE
tara:strand:+ start:289 stop:747 length:459 start_codon:yes stop_codon:yes gene_type:complete